MERKVYDKSSKIILNSSSNNEGDGDGDGDGYKNVT